MAQPRVRNPRPARVARAMKQIYPRLVAGCVNQRLLDQEVAIPVGARHAHLEVDSPPLVSPGKREPTYHEMLQEQRWSGLLNCYFLAEFRLKCYWDIVNNNANPEFDVGDMGEEVVKAQAAVDAMNVHLEEYMQHVTEEDHADHDLQRVVTFCRRMFGFLQDELTSLRS